MIQHSEDFLRKLAEEKVIGDFYPFNTGDIDVVEKYIKDILGQLKHYPSILLKPDFRYYGSGFASYINVKVFKKDGSDTQIIQKKNLVTKSTKGILLYISNLVPYWYYGGSEWSETTENRQFKSSSSSYISPADIDKYNKAVWDKDIEKIKFLMSSAGYNLLTKEELDRPLDFKINIAGNLINGKPKVFDCFFHWED